MAAERGRDPRGSADDALILGAVAAGSPEALASLYGRYAARMLGLAVRLLGNRRDAEDLLHDVFLEVWRTSASYDPERASAGTWLLVKVRSRALDRLRALGAARRFGLGESFDGFDAEDPEADLGVLRQIDRARALDALAALPEPQREIVSMLYLEGRTCSEIARRCGVPLGTVKSRLARALSELRERLPDAEGAD